MKSSAKTLVAAVLLCTWSACTAFGGETQPTSDWPQWRGPNRDGVAPSSPKLMDVWPKEGPPLLWKSEDIPWFFKHSHGSGCGGPVVADGKVFVYVNWRQPIDGGKKYKPITTELLMDCGWMPDVPDALAKKIEDAWASTNRPGGVNGHWFWWSTTGPTDAEVDDYLKINPGLAKYTGDFIGTLDPGDAKKYGVFIKRRFCIPRGNGFTWDELVKMSKIRSTELDSPKEWYERGGELYFGKQAWDGHASIHGNFQRNAWNRATKRTDVVVCLDAATGKTIWKYESPEDRTIYQNKWNHKQATYTRYGASGTPTVSNGKVYAVGARGMYCLSVKDGSLVWFTEVDHPQHASPLVADGVVYSGGNGCAYNADSGKLIWKNPIWANRGADADNGCAFSALVAPLLWTSGGKNYVITTDGGEMESPGQYCCIDMETGKLLWSMKSGKTIFPTLRGDTFIVPGRDFELLLHAYKLTLAGPELIWKRRGVRESYGGDIIDQGYLYLSSHETFCLDMKTSEAAWKNSPGAQDSFSSPILADGKIILPYGSSHGDAPYWLGMFKATPEKYVELGVFRPNMCPMSSPAVAGGKLYLRTLNSVNCYDLQEHGVYLDGVTVTKDKLTFRFKQTGGGLAGNGDIQIMDAGGAAKPAKAQINGDDVVVDIRDVALPFRISCKDPTALTGKNGKPVAAFGWDGARLLKYRKCFDKEIVLASDEPLQKNANWDKVDTYALNGAKVTGVKMDQSGKAVVLTTDKSWKPGDALKVAYACFPVDQGEARRETLAATVEKIVPPSAKFVKIDETTFGNWKGAYGADGAMISGDKGGITAPKYAVAALVNSAGGTGGDVASTETRWLQKPGDSNKRIAAQWIANMGGKEGDELGVDISFTDGEEHQVALFFADNGGHALVVDVRDVDSNKTLDSQFVEKFDKGKYAVWNLKGHVRIAITPALLTDGGGTTLLNGVFFDPPGRAGK